MLILGSIKEYQNYYSQVGRHSASVAAVISILVIVGLIFIVSGIKNKKFLSFFNKKSVIVSVGLIIIAILADYGYLSLSKPKMKEMRFIEHNFSIQFPSSPKITNFRPNPDVGILGGSHVLSQIGREEFMVVYFDCNESMLNNVPKKEFIETMLEKLGFTAANNVESDIQGFLAYRFYVAQENKNHGKGLACFAKNRIYFVVYINEKPISAEKIIDDYLKSFKILNMDSNDGKTEPHHAMDSQVRASVAFA